MCGCDVIIHVDAMMMWWDCCYGAMMLPHSTMCMWCDEVMRLMLCGVMWCDVVRRFGMLCDVLQCFAMLCDVIWWCDKGVGYHTAQSAGVWVLCDVVYWCETRDGAMMSPHRIMCRWCYVMMCYHTAWSAGVWVFVGLCLTLVHLAFGWSHIIHVRSIVDLQISQMFWCLKV